MKKSRLMFLVGAALVAFLAIYSKYEGKAEFKESAFKGIVTKANFSEVDKISIGYLDLQDDYGDPYYITVQFNDAPPLPNWYDSIKQTKVGDEVLIKGVAAIRNYIDICQRDDCFSITSSAASVQENVPPAKVNSLAQDMVSIKGTVTEIDNSQAPVDGDTILKVKQENGEEVSLALPSGEAQPQWKISAPIEIGNKIEAKGIQRKEYVHVCLEEECFRIVK
jgi:hypothetical protein